MSNIISTKDGRLHIYVRQDKYKGKLKSENWVGRTFHNGKQKVISSGTTDLEEAKKILEKWYEDLIGGKLEDSSSNDIAKQEPQSSTINNINSVSEDSNKTEIKEPNLENAVKEKDETKAEKQKFIIFKR